jgi:hypothetical protein
MIMTMVVGGVLKITMQKKSRKNGCRNKKSFDNESKTSITNLTIYGCCNSFKRDISRMAVDGTPSSSAYVWLCARESKFFEKKPLSQNKTPPKSAKSIDTFIQTIPPNESFSMRRRLQ